MLNSSEGVGAALLARLATCTVSQGAETNLGLVQYRGRRMVDPDMVPCVTLVEGDDEITEGDGVGTAGVQVNQSFVMLAFVPCDPDHPNDAAHAALRDMMRAVFRTEGRGDRTLGRQVQRVSYRGRDVGPRSDGDASVCVVLEVAVRFYLDLSNP